MIIKIDVQDNDYGERIIDILDDKVNGLWTIYDRYFSNELEQYMNMDGKDALTKYKEISFKRDDIREWIFNDNIPEDKIEEAKAIIKNCVLFLIRNSFDKDCLDYLEKSIIISFPNTMDAKWENGEVIYYIPNTYSAHKFLLF